MFFVFERINLSAVRRQAIPKPSSSKRQSLERINLRAARRQAIPKPFSSTLLDRMLRKQAVIQESMRRGESKMRAIVAICTEDRICGGLGDRLFGLVTLFVAAMLTDRAFFVYDVKPVPMVDFVVPSRLDWRVDTLKVSRVKSAMERCLKSDGCKPVYMMMAGQHCHDLMNYISTSTRETHVVTANLRTECVLKMLLKNKVLPKNGTAGWDPSSIDSLRFWASNVSHMILNHLFKFRPSLERRAQSLLKGSSLPENFTAEDTRECLLCVHVRSGMKTNEGDRHHNIADFGKCARMVEEQIVALNACTKRPTWIVISDHPNADEIVGGRFAKPLSSSIAGPIIHIDRSGTGEALRAGANRLFVDFYVLTQCKYFVASLSTLAEVASLFHGPLVRRYDMSHNDVCSSQPHNIHNWQRDVHISLSDWQKQIKP